MWLCRYRQLDGHDRGARRGESHMRYGQGANRRRCAERDGGGLPCLRDGRSSRTARSGQVWQRHDCRPLPHRPDRRRRLGRRSSSQRRRAGGSRSVQAACRYRPRGLRVWPAQDAGALVEGAACLFGRPPDLSREVAGLGGDDAFREPVHRLFVADDLCLVDDLLPRGDHR